jgi:hypothetical protein
VVNKILKIMVGTTITARDKETIKTAISMMKSILDI